jgi:hypothetical protein
MRLDLLYAQNQFVVPWCFLSTAFQESTVRMSEAAATPIPVSVATPKMSDKAKGKRPMIDAMSIIEEASEIPVASPVETVPCGFRRGLSSCSKDQPNHHLMKRMKEHIREEEDHAKLLHSFSM